MSRTREEIFVELVDLCAQYKAEVPGKSQAWPKSIKERVAELPVSSELTHPFQDFWPT